MSVITIILTIVIMAVVYGIFNSTKENRINKNIEKNLKKHLNEHFEHTDENKFIKKNVISKEWNEREGQILEMVSNFPFLLSSKYGSSAKKCSICENIHIKQTMWRIFKEPTRSQYSFEWVCIDCAPTWKFWFPDEIGLLHSKKYAYNILCDIKSNKEKNPPIKELLENM